MREKDDSEKKKTEWKQERTHKRVKRKMWKNTRDQSVVIVKHQFSVYEYKKD